LGSCASVADALDALLAAKRYVQLLRPVAATWSVQSIQVVPRERGLTVRASDGEPWGLIDVDQDGEVIRPVQYRDVLVPFSTPPRTVPMPIGYVPERPTRTADHERRRGRFVPGVKVPAEVRP
jgi:hypothetical protein